MVSMYKKRCSISLIMEMQIGSTKRCYYTLTGTAIITIDNSSCWQGGRETGTLTDCLWDCKMIQPLKKVCHLKVKHTLTIYSQWN